MLHTPTRVDNYPHYTKNPLQSWVVCLSAGLFFLYEFIQMSMFNAINPHVMLAFNIDATQLGNLAAAYFYSNVLFLLPAGILLDRISPRRLILMAMALCVLSTFLFAGASSYSVAFFARFLTGVGSAFALIACLKLASRWFPVRRLALASAIIITMAWVGGILAQTPLTLLSDSIGWRESVFINAGLGVLLLIVIFKYVQDYPPNYHSSIHGQAEQSLQQLGFWRSVGLAVRNGQGWLAGLYTSMLNLPIFLLAQTWGVLYLTQVHSFERAEASNATTLIFIGTMVGSPLVGWFSDRIQRRRLPMLLGGVFSLLSMLLILLLPSLSHGMILGLFFAIGFFTSSQVVSYALISESANKAIVSTSLAIASTLIMLGGVTEPLFGWLLDMFWDGTRVNGLPFYSHENFLWALSIIPIAFVIGLVCLFFIRETYCRGAAEQERAGK